VLKPQERVLPGISLHAVDDEIRTWKPRKNDPNVRFMNAELKCAGCGTVSRVTGSWRVYLTADEPPRVTVFCSACVARGLD
jgi:hypothetical protein